MRQNQIRIAAIARTTMPATTPPAMAPTLVDDLGAGDGFEVVVFTGAVIFASA